MKKIITIFTIICFISIALFGCAEKSTKNKDFGKKDRELKTLNMLIGDIYLLGEKYGITNVSQVIYDYEMMTKGFSTVDIYDPLVVTTDEKEGMKVNDALIILSRKYSTTPKVLASMLFDYELSQKEASTDTE